MPGLYLEDLTVGMAAERTRTVVAADVVAFAEVTGDRNPLHLDPDYAATTSFGEPIAHGLLSGGLISALLGTELPGPGAVYLSQSLRFKRPVRLGDEVLVRATVTAMDLRRGEVTLQTVVRARGKVAVEGEAVVQAPRRPAGAPA